jgi:hypothetical protein
VETVDWGEVPENPEALMTEGEWGWFVEGDEHQLHMRGLVSIGFRPSAEALKTLPRDLTKLAARVEAYEAGES